MYRELVGITVNVNIVDVIAVDFGKYYVLLQTYFPTSMTSRDMITLTGTKRGGLA